jgi:hypothetical protein
MARPGAREFLDSSAPILPLQSTLTHRLDHQAIAVAMHDRFAARQLELHENAPRLVAAVAE